MIRAEMDDVWYAFNAVKSTNSLSLNEYLMCWLLLSTIGVNMKFNSYIIIKAQLLDINQVIGNLWCVCTL